MNITEKIENFLFILNEKNIYNQSYIKEFIKGLHPANDNVKKWLNSNLRNFIINDYDNIEPVRSAPEEWAQRAIDRNELFNVVFDRDFINKINHVVDYLNTLQTDISKMSVPEAVSNTDKWSKTFAKQKIKTTDEVENIDIKTIKTYSNGFSWVKVLSEDALAREGKLMNHCVGSYCEQVQSGNVEILSLRDKNNIPHCTIEYKGQDIKQIKGNSNSSVKGEHIEYIKDLIEGNVIKINKINEYELKNAGIIKINDTIYGINSLPSRLKVRGNLDLGFTKIASLPSGLEVEGDLYLERTRITSLPSGLKVGGSLQLNGTNLTSLPPGLKIGGNLDLNATKIASLPPGLEVGGDLFLGFTKITSLPSDLKVSGRIHKDF